MNVPKLRFKEFDGEWTKYLLNDLVDFHNNQRKPVKETDRIIGEFPYYGASGIVGYVNDFIFEGEYLLLSEDGANIVSRNLPIVYKTKGKFWVNNHAHIFTSKSFISQEFLFQYLEKINYIPFNSGTAQPKLNLDSIKSIPLLIPKYEEQEKLSGLLCRIDKKIKLQQQKIDLLQEQKKGYMQEIFSQENKNLKYIKLEDAFDERNEKGFPEYELLAVTLKNGVTDRTDMKKDTSSDDKSNYKRVKVGDIAYNSMRMWQGASGYSNYNGIVSPAYTVLIPKENIDSQFFAYLFKTNFMIYQFKKYSQGLTSDTWNLKYPLLKEIKVKIPSLDQQKRIVEFFTKIDLYINLQKKRLDILKNQKQGFMQQMFI